MTRRLLRRLYALAVNTLGLLALAATLVFLPYLLPWLLAGRLLTWLFSMPRTDDFWTQYEKAKKGDRP